MSEDINYKELLADAHSPHLDVRRKDGGVDVAVTCIYWRKVNAVHAWFVDNCQGGVDECQESDPVDIEQLAYLRHLAQQSVDAVRAGEEPPLNPRAWFFFGSYDLDEWYVRGME